MELDLPISEQLSLRIADAHEGQRGYPTARLQKGFRLVDHGHDLAEEAVGFGLPVLRQGLKTLFPGSVVLSRTASGGAWEVDARFTLNLEERLARSSSGNIRWQWLYLLKNMSAELIRRFPAVRALLTACSSFLRGLFGWVTTYEDAGVALIVRVKTAFDPQSGLLHVNVEPTDLVHTDITEVVLMNEQGAHAFDTYQDASGRILNGKEIGCWDEVSSSEAMFVSSLRRIAFRVFAASGARLYRGRELVGNRLAWSGFGYAFPPGAGKFSYTLRIERLP